MASKKAVSWTNYIEQLGDKQIKADVSKIEGIEKLINLNQHAHNILNHSVPMIYLLNYTTGKYAFVSNECESHLSFSHNKMMDGGVNFVLDNYHPEDLKLFNNQIFADRLKVLEAIPAAQQKNHIFSFNYRIKNGKGALINILQRNAFIQSDENGRPLLS